ncbi:hypothetical protein N8311_02065, partial [bacterium]|nr:hypothetical protein [bacterium]
MKYAFKMMAVVLALGVFNIKSSESSFKKLEPFYYNVPDFYEGKYICKTSASNSKTMSSEYEDTVSYIRMKMFGYDFKINKLDNKVIFLGNKKPDSNMINKVKYYTKAEIEKTFPFKQGTLIDFNKTYKINSKILGNLKLTPTSFSEFNGMNVLNYKYELKTLQGVKGSGLGAIHLQSGFTVKIIVSGKHSGKSWNIKYECNFNGVERISDSIQNLLNKNKKNTIVASKPKTKTYTQPKSTISSVELDASKREAENEKQRRIELERKLAELEKKQKEQQQSKPKTVVAAKPKSEFSNKPINVNFKSIT